MSRYEGKEGGTEKSYSRDNCNVGKFINIIFFMYYITYIIYINYIYNLYIQINFLLLKFFTFTLKFKICL